MLRSLLIADIGSSHLGRFEHVVELLTACHNAEAMAKFQFLTEHECVGTRNLPFNRKWLKDIRDVANDLGVQIGASVWSEDGIRDLVENHWDFCKFAYSQRGRVDLMTMATEVMDLPTFASVHLFDETPVKVMRLWCDPTYPSYVVPPLGELLNRFKGVSFHNLNAHVYAREAIRHGLVAEVHVCLDYSRQVPDTMFALEPKRLREIRA
jgi:sialic acid synthase SpsE